MIESAQALVAVVVSLNVVIAVLGIYTEGHEVFVLAVSHRPITDPPQILLLISLALSLSLSLHTVVALSRLSFSL